MLKMCKKKNVSIIAKKCISSAMSLHSYPTWITKESIGCLNTHKNQFQPH